MKIRRIPQEDIVTLARVVDLEAEEEDEDDSDPFEGGTSIRPGRYAMDGTGSIWRREDTITSMFQEFMDLGEALKPKRGK